MNLTSRIKKIAIQTAIESDHEQYRVGAVVFKKRGNHVIASASNSGSKTHPRQLELASRKNCFSTGKLHAEVRAIIRSKGKGDSIIVCRLGKAGALRLAKPCSVCQEAIRESGIQHVYFTNSLGEVEYYDALDS